MHHDTHPGQEHRRHLRVVREVHQLPRSAVVVTLDAERVSMATALLLSAVSLLAMPVASTTVPNVTQTLDRAIAVLDEARRAAS